MLPNHEERAGVSRRDVAPVPPRRDRGATYVELLVSIVLIGTSVVATLVAVRATLIATSIDNERAEARVWLLEAASQIEADDDLPLRCSTNDYDDIVDAYEAAIVAAPSPDGWASGSLVVTDVTFLGREGGDPNEPYSFGESCVDDADHPHLAQLVTLEVTMPSGEVETLQTVRS